MSKPVGPEVKRTAKLSPCGLYRYTLWRWWDGGPFPGNYVAFVGLNPSTADAMVDDPTLRRCMGFARAWGYGGVAMVNLFAYRATDPRVMLEAADPVGPGNDEHLLAVCEGAELVVCAWGNAGHGYREQGNGQGASAGACNGAGEGSGAGCKDTNP